MKHDPSLEEPVAKVSQSLVILRRLLWFCLPLGCVVGACVLLSISQRPSPPNYHMTYAIQSGRAKVQGVNLAGWLVADYEVTPTSDIYKGVPSNVSALGEYALVDWYKGANKKDDMVKKFNTHRSTWITEEDIKAIADAKLNAVRVPIGFWIQSNVTESITELGWLPLKYSMFAPGAVTYLDDLVKNWAKKYNISVLVDITAALNSQSSKPSAAPVPDKNDFDLAPNKVAYNGTKDLVKFLVNRYKDEDGFLGIGLLNEPGRSQYPKLSHRELAAFYRDVYPWVRNVTKRVVLTTQSFGDVQHKRESTQITDGDETMMTFSIWPEEPETVVNHWQEWHKIMHNDAAFKDDNGLNGLKDDITGWKGTPLFIGSWNAVKYGNGSVPSGEQAAFTKKVLDIVNLAPKGWIYTNWKHDGTMKQWGWSLKEMLAQGIQVVGN